MPGSTDRCPICDESILLPFRKRVSDTQVEVVIACANPQCSAVFSPLRPASLRLLSCKIEEAVKKYPDPLTLDEWYEVWKRTHAAKTKSG